MPTAPRSLQISVLLGCLLGFGAIALAVSLGWTQNLDRAALLALEPVPGWLVEAARAVTQLGSNLVVATWSLLTALGLLLQRRRDAAIRLLAAAGGAMALSPLLKLLFARPRPDAVPHLVEASMPAFPSGHALLAAAAYLTLATVLTPSPGHRPAALTAAIALTLLIGISRVVLGVHYPTDVLAGWLVGIAWALACARPFPSRRS